MTEMFGEAWSPMSVPDLAPDDDDIVDFSVYLSADRLHGLFNHAILSILTYMNLLVLDYILFSQIIFWLWPVCFLM